MGNQQAQADTKAALCQDMAALCKNNPYLPDREGYKRIALSDREWINPMLLAEEGFATDSCFGTYYLWGDAFGLRVSAVGERLLASLGSGDKLRFYYPHGSGSLKEALLEMGRKARKHQADLVIGSVTRKQKEALELAMPGFVFQEKRSMADYIYKVEELAALSGKRFHGKKNHCNRFERENPDWHSEILEEGHIPDCLKLLAQWEENHKEAQDEMQGAERTAIAKAFLHYRELGMEGIVLYAGGQIVGFSFGEPIGEEGFDVHFEKADTGIHGAYAMVNRQMARMVQERFPKAWWLNREEDMGLENLRKAKESYHPAFLAEKYVARIPVG